MAQVVQDAQLLSDFDYYLDYLISEWLGVPEVAAEWDEWDEGSRLTFVFDWGVPADRLHSLRQWAAEGLLTAPQTVRYHELLDLVTKYQPLLDMMLAD